MSKAETLFIAAADVDKVLPHVIAMINDAVERCGDWTLQGIYDELRNERALLWVIWDGKTFLAAAVSQLIKVPRGKICQVIACGGTAESWPEALLPIEAHGKAEGCTRMRIQGRQGWSRVFPAYRLEWVSIEKELA